MLKTIPYIVGDCIETVMRRSASCTNTCGAGQRPVARFNDSGCDCVDDPQYDVGVLLDVGETCPTLSGRAQSGALELYMDDEDDNNKNSNTGWIGQTVQTKNTRFKLCAMPGNGFRRKRVTTPSSTRPMTYAVARMGASCPAGSVSMYRYFDNEDHDNSNSSVGHVPPHASRSSYTRLELCLFRETTSSANSSTSPFPVLGKRYGVFAPAWFT